MRPRATVPTLRESIRAKRSGQRVFLEDPERRVRVPIDTLTLKIVQELANAPQTPGALCKAVGAPRVEVHRRVVLLNRHALLTTPRSSSQVEVCTSAAALPKASAAELAATTLNAPAELQHGCVACGACCHGSDIGPLSETELGHIAAVDWSEHLPSHIDTSALVRQVPDGRGGEVALTAQHQGRCVFLDGDKLCTIHRVAGPEKKPIPCRQFPYTLTRTPNGIDVSFSTECRAWWRARAAGEPVADELDSIRALLSDGGRVLSLPSPVPLHDGVDWSFEQWSAFRDGWLQTVRDAATYDELVLAVITPVVDAWRTHEAAHAESEYFATRDAWGIPASDGDVLSWFKSASAQLHERCRSAYKDLADAYRETEELQQADRVERLAWAVDALFNGRRVDDLKRWEHELTVWREMVLASIYSHEPVRRGGLLRGTATLAWRLITGRLLAGLTAESSMRARTEEQDVGDAMVLVSKLPRGTAYERLIASLGDTWTNVMLFNALAVSGTAPPVGRRLL